MKTTNLASAIAISAVLAVSAYAAKVAFQSDRDGSFNIYLMNPDGTEQVSLTSNAGNNYSPVFSPDGQKIAFISDRSGTTQVYTMQADGSQVQQIPNSDCFYVVYHDWRELAWSRDGTKLLFQASWGSLATINLDGSGRTILFDSGAPGHDSISGFDWGTTTDDIYCSAFVSGNGYDQHTYHYVISTGTWTQISQDSQPDHSQAPALSPDGLRILYQRQQTYSLPKNIFSMDTSGNILAQFTSDTAAVFNSSPAWVGDTGGVVYSSDRSGSHQIWITDSTGTISSMLTTVGNNYLPSYSALAGDSIAAILDFFQSSVANGSLVPVKSGPSGTGQMRALFSMLQTASDLLNAGDFQGAYDQLQAALRKTDGQPTPPDFVSGPAAQELAQEIQDLMSQLAARLNAP